MANKGLIIGTCHFVSKAAAIRYYREYGYTDTAAAVERKLAEGEIKIGPPAAKLGDLIAACDGGRYIIIEQGE